MESNIEPDSEKRGELAPQRLGEKLRRIRDDYDLTQGKILLIVNPTEVTEDNRARVSQYERSLRIPSLVETYNYARFAGVTMEMLVNDELDLPATTKQNSNGQDEPESTTTEGETLTSNNDESSPPVSESEPPIQSPNTCLMPHSVETLQECRKMYFELLEDLPFDCCSHLTLNGLIEEIFAVVFSDYALRQKDSEIACRVRLLIEKCRSTSV